LFALNIEGKVLEYGRRFSTAVGHISIYLNLCKVLHTSLSDLGIAVVEELDELHIPKWGFSQV